MTAGRSSGDAVAALVARFGGALRQAGVDVGPSRLLSAVRALGCVDLGRRTEVYWALRCTLISRHDDADAFDAAFRAFWEATARVAPAGGTENGPPGRGTDVAQPSAARPDAGDTVAGDELSALLRAAADPSRGADAALGWWPATTERLRHADFATYRPDELRAARQLVERLATALPRRRSRRLVRGRGGGRVDQRQTLRLAMRTDGLPIVRAWRAPRVVERKLVFVIDVSRSMEPYARPMVMFAQAAVRAGSRVEAYSFGTRLTRLTPQLAQRDPARALALAARAVPDWSGGTRIGESLEALHRSPRGRTLMRGAVVVIVSDGLERGDAVTLGAVMAQIHRAAHRVLWVNPLAGHPGYAPLAAGMAAARPHVDELLPGDDLAALERLAAALEQLPRRRAPPTTMA